MGICQSKVKQNDCEMCAYIDEMYEDFDKVTELKPITMKSIKHDIIMNKLRLRELNIQKIYANELNKFCK